MSLVKDGNLKHMRTLVTTDKKLIASSTRTTAYGQASPATIIASHVYDRRFAV